MTITELIAELSVYPKDAVVTKAAITIDTFNMTSKIDYSKRRNDRLSK